MLIPVGVDDVERYESLLAREGADYTTVPVPGAVRVASIYLEQAVDRVTVVNDAGAPMKRADWDRVRGAARGLVSPGDIVLCMGSFPPELPAGSLGGLIDDVHAAGGRMLVDTAPEWLSEALTHGADVVTPNLEWIRTLSRPTPCARARRRLRLLFRSKARDARLSPPVRPVSLWPATARSPGSRRSR